MEKNLRGDSGLSLRDVKTPAWGHTASQEGNWDRVMI